MSFLRPPRFVPPLAPLSGRGDECPATYEIRATDERPTAYDVASSHERAATGEAAGTDEIAKSPKIRVLTRRRYPTPAHWGMPDPAAKTGTIAEMYYAFGSKLIANLVRAQLSGRLDFKLSRRAIASSSSPRAAARMSLCISRRWSVLASAV